MNLYTLDDPINAKGPAFFAEPRYAHTHTCKDGLNNKSASFLVVYSAMGISKDSRSDFRLPTEYQGCPKSLRREGKVLSSMCTKTAKERAPQGYSFSPFYI